MMDGEHKFVVVVVSLALISGSILILVTLLLVWELREWILTIGGVLLTLFFLSALGVWVARQVNEQHLRRRRVLYRQELPLDEEGTPYYLPLEMQAYHQRQASRHPKEQHAYHSVEECLSQEQQGWYER